MHISRLQILSLATIALLTGSCKKESNDHSDVTFTNQMSEKVTLDIYSSEKDYAGNSNIMLRKVLSPNENTILPGSTFKSGSAYFMDWYTNDLKHHNWFNDNYPVASTATQVKFTPVAGNNTYYIKPQAAAGARSVFLKGGISSSRWTAVGVYAYSKNTGYVSYWDNLSPKERFREVTVNKNFTINYSYQNESGNVITENADFRVHATEQAYIEIMDASKQADGYMATGRLPAQDGSEYLSSSDDSLMALLPHSDYYFLMVRTQ